MDIFLTTTAFEEEPIRWHLMQACLARWKMDPWASWPGVKLVGPEHVPCTVPEFQRERRILADRLASTPVYILADDDCLPLGVRFLERGLEVMERHPDFGMLCAMNFANQFQSQPSVGEYIDGQVWECHAPGGIRFCRKGHVKDWPQAAIQGSYDMEHYAAAQAAGWRTGYMRTVLMNHIGYFLSTHWPPEETEIEKLLRERKEAHLAHGLPGRASRGDMVSSRPLG